MLWCDTHLHTTYCTIMNTIDPQQTPSTDRSIPIGDTADLVWTYLTSVKTIQRRNGQQESFQLEKIRRSIELALRDAGAADADALRVAKNIAEKTIAKLTENFDGTRVPASDDVRDTVIATLIENNLGHIARAYIQFGMTKRTSAPQVNSTVSAVAPSMIPSIPVAPVIDYTPRRHRLNEERKAITHKFQVGSHEGYLTVGMYDDTRQPGEIFVRMSKEGSVMSGLVDAFATSISIGLQYGVPLKVYVNKFSNMRFEPSGITQNPNIPEAKSIIDYIFRWLAMKFLTPEERQSAMMTEEGFASHVAERQPKLLDIDPRQD